MSIRMTVASIGEFYSSVKERRMTFDGQSLPGHHAFAMKLLLRITDRRGHEEFACLITIPRSADVDLIESIIVLKGRSNCDSPVSQVNTWIECLERMVLRLLGGFR